jgi:peptidylprolyl isomerase
VSPPLRILTAAGLLALLPGASLPRAAQDPQGALEGYRQIDPENGLLIQTTKGDIIVEMRPDLAPKAVARVKTLARSGVYDGLLFHRVIDGFVDQTGNPNNRDGGTSALPDLPPEFDARLEEGAVRPAARRAGAILGFLGALPVMLAGRAGPDGRRRVWGLYCAGVAGMGRQADPGSANSEIFFMRAPARRLDRAYTVFGRAVVGLDVIRAVAVGVPPPRPDRMLKVRILADLPPTEREKVFVLDERGAAFATALARARAARGADFSPCDLDLPARIAP